MWFINRRIQCAFAIKCCILFMIVQTNAVDPIKWITIFEPNNLTVNMYESKAINLSLSQLDTANLIKHNAKISIVSDTNILEVSKQIALDEIVNDQWNGRFNVTAVFLGNANVFVRIEQNGSVQQSTESLTIVIKREERFIDTLFVVSVVLLVSILYINFGAALDLRKVKEVFIRPIGPVIALFCHFLILPLASYGLGLFLFPNNVELQLGLFFTGVCPAGGASNMWTVILGGNLDLSIAMTTTSTIAAFAMLPLWIFTLGKRIFERGNLVVPYSKIASYAYGLIIPLAIGLLIQRYCPRLTRLLVRIMKTFSSILILFIVIFAIITNLYLFQLFTWEILVAGLALPWIGYLFGWIFARLFQLEYGDRLAVSIESGVQNTGIAIFILRFALGQPQADLTTVIPVSVAIMTPFPLILYYICYKFRECFRCRRSRTVPSEVKECIESQSNNGS